jgi:hypothetical protein
MAVLLLAFTATAQSRPADETYTYSISAEGIPLETLVHHAEQATGKSFVYSEQSGLKGKKVLMIGTARVPALGGVLALPRDLRQPRLRAHPLRR